MDKQQSTKMPKPFDTENGLNSSPTSATGNTNASASGNQQQFVLREDDRLKQEEEYRQELMKVQDEIVTLRQVLSAKLKREGELKTLLGVGFVDDLKQDWTETVSDIKATTAYQKTAETLSAASEKLAPTIQSVNSTLKSGIGSLRNSSYFKSFGSTVGSTVSAVKSKMGSSKSTNFNEENSETDHGATGGSMSASETHDEHLHFASGNADGKK